MGKFPDPVELPDFVDERREGRLSNLTKTITIGLGIKLFIIIIEFAAFYFYGGHSILLDAIASLVDLGSSFCLLLFVRLASKPPDRNHPFGHGRLEPLAGLQLAILLSVIGVGLFIQQSLELFQEGASADIGENVWIVPLIAIVLLEVAYRRMIYVARKENSPGLAADAVHYRIDATNSFIAALALFIASFFPGYNGWIDRIGAMGIALLMVFMGIKVARENFHQLMDRRPEGSYFKRVRQAALKVAGVLETEKVQIQMYGPDAHVDIDIEVDPKMEIEEAHRLTQLVRAEVQKDWPQVRDVTVHVEPFYPNDHK